MRKRFKVQPRKTGLLQADNKGEIWFSMRFRRITGGLRSISFQFGNFEISGFGKLSREPILNKSQNP
jgi:hypothetical protein